MRDPAAQRSSQLLLTLHQLEGKAELKTMQSASKKKFNGCRFRMNRTVTDLLALFLMQQQG